MRQQIRIASEERSMQSSTDTGLKTGNGAVNFPRQFLQCVLPVLLLLFGDLAAQPLDWNSPLTVFGTADNEYRPSMTIAPGAGAIRVLCVRNSDAISAKLSQDNGLNWTAAADLPVTGTVPIVRAASGLAYDYILLADATSGLRVFRFSPGQTDWNAAVQSHIAPQRTDIPVAADLHCGSADTMLAVSWLGRAASNVVCGLFARSVGGANFRREDTIFVFSAGEFAEPDIDLAVTETATGGVRYIAAAAIDRPGSVPEQICVFRSDDLGTTWSDSVVVDDSAYPQRQPALAANSRSVLLVYSRRTSAAAQRDIFYTYAPDGGGVFATPGAVTDSLADEHSPQLVVDAAGGMFYIVYLAGTILGDDATVMLCSGSLAAPWAVGPPLMLSEVGNAAASGGVAIAAGPAGAAAAWTARFPLGDTDIRFDAAWRGSSLQPHGERVVTTLTIGGCFPNPCNAATVLPFILSRPERITFAVTDLLGRTLMTMPPLLYAAGSHELRLDLSGFPSGIYFITQPHADYSPARVVLLR